MKKTRHVIVLTGGGKGKTTAALGMVLRCLGHGGRVALIRFLKGSRIHGLGGVPGEITALRKFGPQINVWSFGRKYTWLHSWAENRRIVSAAWKKATRVLRDPRYDLIVLDEINYCMKYRLLSTSEVLKAIRRFLCAKPRGCASAAEKCTHIVLTGNGAPRNILRCADLVTEMRCVKHPFAKGASAKPGVEF
ncbi:MAG: cob(I)yrinic acid a,c-diamide adenosyltransferase [Candidatus Omnitrophota bacterium]